MKSILLSIKPQYVAKILNGEKTLEIRKTMPKCDLPIEVYIYCTKNGALLFKEYSTNTYWAEEENKNYRPHYALNGKVVARFWCDKVEEHKDFGMFPYRDLRFNKATCLSGEDLEDYGFVEGKGYVPLYAIHITKLEVFDKPKEISEFKTHLGCNKSINCMFCKYNVFKECTRPRYLTRAPQSWCFIEV